MPFFSYRDIINNRWISILLYILLIFQFINIKFQISSFYPGSNWELKPVRFYMGNFFRFFPINEVVSLS